MAALVGRSTLHPRAVTLIVQNLLIKFCFGNLVLRLIIIMRMMMIVIGKSSYLVVKWVKWWLLELSSDGDEEGWGWGLELGWKWEFGNGRPLQQSGWHVRAEDNVAATSISNPTANFSWWLLLLSPSGDLGMGLVWDNLSTPTPLDHFSIRPLKSSSNWTKLSIMGPQLFSGWYQMILDVFRCSQLFSDCLPIMLSDCWNPLQADLNYL